MADIALALRYARTALEKAGIYALLITEYTMLGATRRRSRRRAKRRRCSASMCRATTCAARSNGKYRRS